MDLILLGGFTGKEVDAHGLGKHRLTMLGWLDYDHRLAHLSYGIGTLLMLASLLWEAGSCTGRSAAIGRCVPLKAIIGSGPCCKVWHMRAHWRPDACLSLSHAGVDPAAGRLFRSGAVLAEEGASRFVLQFRRATW